MTFIFRKINKTDVDKVLRWRYEPPYDIYNLEGPLDAQDLAYFLDPQNAFQTITSNQGELLAFCSFGPDGQVPGGDYRQEALDIGLGVRPDLTGRGLGAHFVQAVLDYARDTFAPAMFRVTIAGFNRRAMRVWQKAGFQPVSHFESDFDGQPFVILTQDAR
jgi:GNAT superfamily N-acetyltransferase